MPIYRYHCANCKSRFEDLNTIANRHTSECLYCGKRAEKVIDQAPRIDPNMDTPGARMKFRKDAMKRGRGADMTDANRSVEDYATRESAWHARQVNGEGKTIVS